MDLIAFFLIVWAFKHAWDHSRGDFAKSKAAHRQKQPAKQKRAAELVHHDIGYWTHQGTHGFPAFRHGFGQGWHEARQKAVKAREARERAKAEHLETAADLEPEVTGHRQRQAEARDRIREARQPGEGSGEGSPEVQPDDGPDDREDQDDPAQPTYSYGPASASSGWPAGGDAEKAHHYAQRAGSREKPWVVTEYPPGGGPGKTVATYPDVSQEPGGRDTEDEPSRETAGDGPATQGDSMPAAADTTYDGVLSSMAAAKNVAEGNAAEAQTASRNADNLADEMQALEVDPATLSAMADHQAAHDGVTKAYQRLLESAENVVATLKRGHKDLAEAHQNAPVEAAEKQFYAA